MTSAAETANRREPPALEVRNLDKSFAAVRALREVSLSVRAGEVLALIGDNGAGKSTLIKCVSGLVHPDGGQILIDGTEVTINSPEDARAHGVETVHQNLMLWGGQDVAANLYMGREIESKNRLLRKLRWLDMKAMHAGSREILNELRINIPSTREPVDNLSGGQRQSIAVGRAVAWGTHIVLLDEPSAALGVEQSRHVLRLIRTLAERNVAVVFISHNMQHVLEVCDVAYCLRHGEMVGRVNIDDVTAADLVDLITGVRRQAA